MFKVFRRNKGPEAGPVPAAAASEKKPASKVENPLNNRGFVEFLDKQKLDLTGQSKEQVGVHFEAFKRGQEAVRALQNIYAQELKTGSKGQLELGQGAKDAIEAYVQERVATNPEAVNDIIRQIEEFKTVNAQIAQEEAKIQKAREEMAAAQKAQEGKETKFKDKQKELLKPTLNVFKWGAKAAWAGIRNIFHKNITGVKEFQKQTNKINDRINDTAQLEQMKGQLNNLKEDLFQTSELAGVVNGEIAKEVQSHFSGKSNKLEKLSIAELEKMMDSLENMEDAEDNPDSPPSLNYLSVMKKSRTNNPEQMKGKLEKELTGKIRKTILEAFTKEVPTLSGVMNKLTGFMKQRKKVGGMKGMSENGILIQAMEGIKSSGKLRTMDAGKRLVFNTMLEQLQEESGSEEAAPAPAALAA